MKKNKTFYKGILFLFLFILSTINVTAQTCSLTANIPINGSTTINGITITTAPTGSVEYISGAGIQPTTACPSYPISPGHARLGTLVPSAFSLTFNFSQTVNDLVILLNGTGSGNGSNENFTFTSNNGTVGITSVNSCASSISGNTIFSGAGAPANSGGGGGNFRISTPSGFTSLTVSGTGGLGGSAFGICQSTIIPFICTAGSNAPTFNVEPNFTGSIYTIPCGSTTANLSGLTESNNPGILPVTWHTSSVASDANKLTSVSALNIGTYYAAFWDGTNSCYSPTRAISVTEENCITANADSYLLPASTATTTASVIVNDTNNGAAVTLGTTGNSTLTWTGTNPTGFTRNANGTITVASTAAQGLYNFGYQICDKNVTTNCKTATVTVVVGCSTGNVTPNLSTATNFASNIYTIPCGSTTADLSAITASNNPGTFPITWHTAATASDANKLPSTTALSPGTYYAAFYDSVYSCYSPTRLVTVTEANCITATAETLNVSSGTATTTSSVITNDTNNGVAVTLGTTGNSTFTWVSAAPTGFTLNADGTITVASTATLGTRTLTYQICDKEVTANCRTAVATIVVAPRCTVNGITITATGTSTATYAAPNPTTNQGCPTSAYTGTGIATGTSTAGTLTYTFSSPVISARIFYSSVQGGAAATADSGTFSVNGGGTMSLSNPCGVSISGNVATGTATGGTGTPSADASLTVTSTVPFTTLTVTNTGGRTGWSQGNLCDFVLTTPCTTGSNPPTLNAGTNFTGTVYTIPCGSTAADLSAITSSNNPGAYPITWHTGASASDANKVAATGLGAGTYYAAFWDSTVGCYSPTKLVTITEANCITLTGDTFTASSSTANSTVSVITNDTNNGVAVTLGTTGNSTLTWVTAAPSGLTLNADGTISIAAGALSGAYNLTYQICDKDVPGNCKTAAVTLNIFYSSCTVNGVTITSTGTKSSNYIPVQVAGNNGCALSPYAGSGGWTGLALNGFVTYTFSTPVTSATVTYTAYNFGGFEGTDTGNITVNGGGTVTLSNACNVNISGTNIVASLPTDGTFGDVSVKVSSTVPFTTLTIRNTTGTTGIIQGNPCDFTFTTVCTAGTSAPALVAATNFASNTFTIPCGSTSADLATLTASNNPGTLPITWHTGATASNANKITATALGLGTYYAAFWDNTNSCYSPTRLVTVTEANCIVTNAETFNSTLGTATTTASVVANYTNNGTAVTLGTTGNSTLTWQTTAPAGFTLNTDGTISIAASVPAGNYSFNYQVCDKDVPTNCSTATATVIVGLSACNAGTVAPNVN